MTRTGALLVAVAITAVACGGGGGGAVTAELDIIDPRADVRTAGAEEYATGEDGAALELGDGVRTDRNGFAEIGYPDGSLTRIDRDTEFQVVALGEVPEGPDVQAELGVGRAWNRVNDISEGGRFEVQTSVATATVRGTAFDVDCAFGCLFRVLDGTVEVSDGDGASVSLDAGQGVQVSGDGRFGPILALAVLGDDRWLSRNLELDGASGFPLIELPPGPDPGRSGIGGTWDVRFVATENSTDPEAPPGSSSDVTFTIDPECDAGPCDATIDAGQAGTFDIVLAGGVHTIDDTEQTTTAECQPRPVFDRRVTGSLLVTTVIADQPDQAAVFVGTVREEFTPLPDAVAAGCAEDGVTVRESEVRGLLRL